MGEVQILEFPLVGTQRSNPPIPAKNELTVNLDFERPAIPFLRAVSRTLFALVIGNWRHRWEEGYSADWRAKVKSGF